MKQTEHNPKMGETEAEMEQDCVWCEAEEEERQVLNTALNCYVSFLLILDSLLKSSYSGVKNFIEFPTL